MDKKLVGWLGFGAGMVAGIAYGLLQLLAMLQTTTGGL